jgi:hypothetical protein
MIDYRKYIKNVCERCGIEDKEVLLIHHKNGDRDNNTPENLQTLCYNCHRKTHIEINIKKNKAFIYPTKYSDWFDIFFEHPIKFSNELLFLIGFRKYSKVFCNDACRKDEIIGMHIHKEDLEALQ